MKGFTTWIRDCSSGMNTSMSNSSLSATMSFCNRSSSCAPFFTLGSASADSLHSPSNSSLKNSIVCPRATLAILYIDSHA